MKVVKEPVGVCALIPAWNVPMLLFINKLLPALAAGNTVVVKPSELTPHTTTAAGATVRAAAAARRVQRRQRRRHGGGRSDEPCTRAWQDLLHRLHRGRQAHPGNAAASLKRVTLELGGKGAAIVTADADLNAVAQAPCSGQC